MLASQGTVASCDRDGRKKSGFSPSVTDAVAQEARVVELDSGPEVLQTDFSSGSDAFSKIRICFA